MAVVAKSSNAGRISPHIMGIMEQRTYAPYKSQSPLIYK